MPGIVYILNVTVTETGVSEATPEKYGYLGPAEIRFSRVPHGRLSAAPEEVHGPETDRIVHDRQPVGSVHVRIETESRSRANA